MQEKPILTCHWFESKHVHITFYISVEFPLQINTLSIHPYAYLI